MPSYLAHAIPLAVSHPAMSVVVPRFVLAQAASLDRHSSRWAPVASLGSAGRHNSSRIAVHVSDSVGAVCAVLTGRGSWCLVLVLHEGSWATSLEDLGTCKSSHDGVGYDWVPETSQTRNGRRLADAIAADLACCCSPSYALSALCCVVL